MSFVLYLPDPLGMTADFERTPDEVSALRRGGIDIQNVPYQMFNQPVPTLTEMGRIVATKIAEQRIRHNSIGIVVTKGVGAMALIRAAQLVKEKKDFPLPHVLFVSPVTDTAHIIEKQGGTVLSRAFMDDAIAMRDLPLKTFPSVTVLTGEKDVFCPPDAAQRLINSLPAHRRYDPIIWHGGHNDSDGQRDASLLDAVMRTQRLEAGFDEMHRNTPGNGNPKDRPKPN